MNFCEASFRPQSYILGDLELQSMRLKFIGFHVKNTIKKNIRRFGQNDLFPPYVYFLWQRKRNFKRMLRWYLSSVSKAWHSILIRDSVYESSGQETCQHVGNGYFSPLLFPKEKPSVDFCVRYYKIKRNGAYQINVSAEKFTFHDTDRRQVSYIVPSKLVLFFFCYRIDSEIQPDVALFHPGFSNR